MLGAAKIYTGPMYNINIVYSKGDELCGSRIFNKNKNKLNNTIHFLVFIIKKKNVFTVYTTKKLTNTYIKINESEYKNKLYKNRFFKILKTKYICIEPSRYLFRIAFTVTYLRCGCIHVRAILNESIR